MGLDRLRLRAFDFDGVTLEDPRLRRQLEQTLETFLAIPNESLLHGFRSRARMPAPGASLGGWYGDDVFNPFGQYLSGYARFYAATRDPRALAKTRDLVHEWSRTIDPDGFFFYSNRRPKATHYFYDKMVAGLVDAFRYAGIEEALSHLAAITDWADRNLSRENPFAKNAMHSPTEWYTLSENLYRAYEVTGSEIYRKLAVEFLYNEYFELLRGGDLQTLLAAGAQSTTRRYHAYSHVNALSGAAMAYLLGGEGKYLDALVSAARLLVETQCYPTGGYGPLETFMAPGQRAECLHSEDKHFETPCGSWAVLKLARYLTLCTGSASYADWVERLLYNGIGAALSLKANGEVMYFSDYSVRGARKTTSSPWSCCTGTYPQAVCDYGNHIYYHSGDGLFVSQFLSSTVEWKVHGRVVRVEQKGDFPVAPVTRLRISVDAPTPFRFGIRIPEWALNGLAVTVGGKPCSGTAQDGWFVLDRQWRDGDVVEARFDVGVTARRVEPQEPFPIAWTYGPVVLASIQDPPVHLDVAQASTLAGHLERTSRDRLSFSAGLPGSGSLDLVPFYEIEEGRPYVIFWDPADRRIRPPEIQFGPDAGLDWKTEPWGRVSLGYRAGFRVRFFGNGVRWVGKQLREGGRSTITIDGAAVGTVDQYGPFDGIPWMWESPRLPIGDHEMTVTLQNEKNVDGEARTVTHGGCLTVCHVSPIGDGAAGGEPPPDRPTAFA